MNDNGTSCFSHDHSNIVAFNHVKCRCQNDNAPIGHSELDGVSGHVTPLQLGITHPRPS